MTSFLQLNFIYRAIIISLYYLALTGLIFLLIIRWIRKCRPYTYLIFMLLIMTVGILLGFLMEGHNSIAFGQALSPIGQWVSNLSLLTHMLILLVLALCCILGILREKTTAKRKITLNSIRLAFDNLPIGLCFSDQNGIPLLSNRKMHQLAEEATERLYQNAEQMWQEFSAIRERKGIERLRGEDIPTFRWNDGSIWQFSRTEITLQNRRYIQTLATDITRLYTLTEELEKSNTALDKQYKRLNNLMNEIVQITQDEAILASKIKIHKELGECLLTSRRYLVLKHSEKDVSDFFKQWQNVIWFMEGSLKEEKQPSDYAIKELIDAAESLGCVIIFKGATQEEAGRHAILKNAIREAMTNAVRHAGANELTVYTEIQNDILYATIKDNSNRWISSITEGSGLSNLRSRIEQADGNMEIRCGEGVKLHIMLPIKEEL